MTKRKGVVWSRNPKKSLYWLSLRLRLLITPFLLVIVLTVLGITASDYTFSLGHCIDCPWDYGFWLHLFSWVIVLTVLGVTASRNPKDSQCNDPREKVKSEAVTLRTVNTMTKRKGVIRSRNLRSLYWLFLGLRLQITPFLLIIVLTVLGITASDYTFSLRSLYWLSLGLRLLITPFLYNDQEKRCSLKP
jgi:uncharacterized membrane protein